MPRKINMFLSNGNHSRIILNQINTNSLASNSAISTPKAYLPLNASILARIHNVQPGCGSCGRH
jgi:hypothetical protein